MIIPNHFKSKRNGNDEQSMERRKSHAIRAHNIAIAALERSEYILVGGDLNNTPDSDTIKELFKDGFKDVMGFPRSAGVPTPSFGRGSNLGRSYLFRLSPELTYYRLFAASFF